MTDADQVNQALAELQEVVRCRCDEAYRDRGLKDPHCECDSAEAVKVVARRIEELTAELAGARDDAKGAEAKALRAAADMTLGLSNARACRTAILAMIPKGDSHDPL